MKKWWIVLAVCQTIWAKESLPADLEKWRKNHGIPAVVLLVEHGKKSKLYISQRQKQAITASSLFGVGSITKTFVSVLILKLEAAGKLSLNDTLGQYLPQFPHWRPITFLQLLNMTSGIADPQLKLDPARSIALSYATPAYFAPGKAWRYSNTNYLLLGLIIEKVTHKPWVAILDEQLLKPLGLNHSYYSESQGVEPLAKGMHNGQKVNYGPGFAGAAGGMLMNAKDIALWTRHLFVWQDVLPSNQLKKMLTTVAIPYTPLRPKNTRFGLGIFVSDKAIWYTGVIDGYSSTLLWLPVKQVLVVAQINAWDDHDFNLLFPQRGLIRLAIKKAEQN